MRLLPFVVLLSVAPLRPIAAQDSLPPSITNDGVIRASALVDSVYIDRQLDRATVPGGDFVSYLIARLGVRPIPATLTLGVIVDTGRVALTGKVRDLPPEARGALGPILSFLDPETDILADVGLTVVGPRAVRYRLRQVVVNGVPLPETLLQFAMSQVGRQYPALTASGRDLYIAIPYRAGMALVSGGVLLTAPPAGGPAGQ